MLAGRAAITPVTVMAEHHFVSPGYLELAGLDLVDGTDLPSASREDGERYALVSETLARTAFEAGRPIGKRILVGGDLDGWYTIVGVVSERTVRVPGEDGLADHAVWLDISAHDAIEGTLLLRGTSEAVEAATDTLGELGFPAATGTPLPSYRAAAAAPLGWARGVVWLALLLVALLACHGVYEGSRQTTRRRASEMALRAAVGATPGRLMRAEVGRRLRVVGWGAAGATFFGTLTIAFLQEAGGMPLPDPLAAIGAFVVLLAISLLASIRSVREAGGVEPASLLR